MKQGLVLEGGAMRALFTAGVLDVLMENNVAFDGAIGVSAGACFGCNYKGALEIFIYYSCDHVTAINNSVYPSIKIISVEGNEILETCGFYGSTINVSNETFNYKIPEKYRYSDLYVLVDNQNDKSGSGSIYVKGIAFKYI